MANPQEIESAIKKLRVPQAAWGRPGARIHETGLDVANALRNALEHPCCGECSHLVIEPTYIDRKDSVNLRCSMGYSPFGLWINWTPDEVPITCPDCTDPAGRKSTS